MHEHILYINLAILNEPLNMLHMYASMHMNHARCVLVTWIYFKIAINVAYKSIISLNTRLHIAGSFSLFFAWLPPEIYRVPQMPNPKTTLQRAERSETIRDLTAQSTKMDTINMHLYGLALIEYNVVVLLLFHIISMTVSTRYRQIHKDGQNKRNPEQFNRREHASI